MSKEYAYAALDATSPLTRIEFEAIEPAADHVQIEILYSSICHSDIYKLENAWQNTRYPLVPGHEVLGRVRKVGADVTHLVVGDIVGCGPQRNSCHSCQVCDDCTEQLCGKYQGLYDPFYGGYSTCITVPAAFSFKIPSGLALDKTAPLLCAGVTTFSPLSRFAKAGDSVAVVGLGGLGHMAVQFAAAMGCDVCVFSSSEAKRDEAVGFGAKRYVVTGDAEAMAALKGTFDFVLYCSSASGSLGTYTRLLKPRKTMCLLGLPAVDDPLKFSGFDLVIGEKSIAGSFIGGSKSQKDMLDFASEHNILPTCEMYNLEDVNEALQRVRDNKARYRVVMKVEGFRERVGLN